MATHIAHLLLVCFVCWTACTSDVIAGKLLLFIIIAIVNLLEFVISFIISICFCQLELRHY